MKEFYRVMLGRGSMYAQACREQGYLALVLIFIRTSRGDCLRTLGSLTRSSSQSGRKQIQVEAEFQQVCAAVSSGRSVRVLSRATSSCHPMARGPTLLARFRVIIALFLGQNNRTNGRSTGKMRPLIAQR